ncbi:MAG TPA: serine/threonine-protein kinase [Gemmatimonadales bacterium]|nr:serine/threonine-protein kinase [Gemmatimonadales bacterium]
MSDAEASSQPTPPKPEAAKPDAAFRRLHKFELHERIGEGAMGVVWKAYDSVLRRFVALKLLNPSFGRTQELRERFHREARAAAALQHPNIVTVYDLGESDGQLFIAMELVEGRDLSDLIAVRAPLPLEHKLDVVIELLQGLGYAHARGVIHRDVKPSNVRIAADGRVKIMDFGIARLQNADRTGSGGVIVGTPSYMAPEQITNGEITPATDVFAVGCLLYELLTYERPFEAETVHGVFYQVLSTTPKPLRTVAPSMPASLERVVLKAMAKTPGERYGTADEFRSSLLGMRHALSDPTSVTTEQIRFKNPFTRISLNLIAPASLKSRATVLILLLAAAVFIAYLSLSTPTPPPAPPPTAAAVPVLSSRPIPGLPRGIAILRDTAYAQRARALEAGGLVNNVQSMINADAILIAADKSARGNDLVRASTGYGSVAPMYRRAVAEADSARLDARRRLDRATTLVRSMRRTPPTRISASLTRADSLFNARDYVMSAIASGATEQAAIAAGARVRTVTPQPKEPHAAILQLLDDFSRAIQSRKVSNMRVLYPSITKNEVKNWEEFFNGVTSVDVNFAPDSLTIKDPTARGVVHAHFFAMHGGSPTPQESQQTFVTSFRHNAGGWRIAGILSR